MGTFKAIALVKGWARRCAAELYALSPGYLNCLQGKVAILTYHRVVSNKELESEHIQPGMYVTADTFAMHMQFLKRSEEHTSELQSQSNLVCRLLLEKKKESMSTIT